MEQHDDGALIVYTDGSCKSKPRRGGAAFVLVWTGEDGHDQTHEEIVGGYLGATNNEMELVACIEALKYLRGSWGRCPVHARDFRKIVVYSDSAYVVDHVSFAETSWPQNDWIKRDGDPVENPDLWKELIREKSRRWRVEFRKVKGHGSNSFNKRADRLAREAADVPTRKLRGSPLITRKRSSETTRAKSVPMLGQEEIIRIIEVAPLDNRHHKYRYEVVNSESEHDGKLDHVFARNSDMALRRGHVYWVRFCGPGEGRWLREMLGELDRKFGLPQATGAKDGQSARLAQDESV